MRRFYDTVINERWFRPEDEEDIKKAVVVVADQATEYYYAINDKEYWHLTDFPNIAPPFNNFFIETKRPSKIVSKRWGVREWFEPATRDMLAAEGQTEPEITDYLSRCAKYGNKDQRRPLHWGIHFRTITIDKLRASFQGRYIPPEELAQVKWAIKGMLYIDWPDACTFQAPVWEIFMGLREDGSVQATSIVENAGLGVDGPAREYQNKMSSKYVTHEGKTELFGALRQEMINHINPMLLAVSFMHCKNVELVHSDIPRKLIKRAQERGNPIHHHRIIDILPLKKVLRVARTPEDTGIKIALQRCRGHFKTYTEARPLLGRAVGTFFWAERMSVVEKAEPGANEYRIKADPSTTRGPDPDNSGT